MGWYKRHRYLFCFLYSGFVVKSRYLQDSFISFETICILIQTVTSSKINVSFSIVHQIELWTIGAFLVLNPSQTKINVKIEIISKNNTKITIEVKRENVIIHKFNSISNLENFDVNIFPVLYLSPHTFFYILIFPSNNILCQIWIPRLQCKWW